MATQTLASPRPLLVTDDPLLLDEVLRIAGSVRVDVEVATDAVAARAGWYSAPIVVVGIGLADECAQVLPPRGDLILVDLLDRVDSPEALETRLSVHHLALLPEGGEWLGDCFASGTVLDQPAPPPDTRRSRMIAVIGGRGGAGASVLAASLALSASQSGGRVLLVDGDPLGGGLDLVLGWERTEGIRWSDLRHTNGRIDPPVLRDVLPRRGELAVLSCDSSEVSGVPVAAMEAAIEAGRACSDVVVVDVPRHLDEAAVVALSAADRVLLVVPGELRACAAAKRVADEVRRHNPALSLVVREPGNGHITPVGVAGALNLPLAGTMRLDRPLLLAMDGGNPPNLTGRSALAALCRRLLGEPA